MASAGRIARAELADGRIGKLVFRANGLERAIEYARVGPHWAATAYRTGEETLRAIWADAGGGWLFPSGFEFRAVFGKSWGPEKMTITNVVDDAVTRGRA